MQHACPIFKCSRHHLSFIILLKVSPLEEKIRLKKMNEFQNDIERFLLIPFRFRFYRENKG